MKKEIWKDIPGYEGSYQVSNWGQIKSLKYGKERLLKPCTNTKGYLYINFYKDGKVKIKYIHQLVAMVFLGHTPNGYETVVNHIDNNPLNNNVDNLEITTQRINTTCHKTDAGVNWDKDANKWRAQIQITKKIYLGLFTEKEEALATYQKALVNTHLYDGNNKKFRNLLAQ